MQAVSRHWELVWSGCRLSPGYLQCASLNGGWRRSRDLMTARAGRRPGLVKDVLTSCSYLGWKEKTIWESRFRVDKWGLNCVWRCSYITVLKKPPLWKCITKYKAVTIKEKITSYLQWFCLLVKMNKKKISCQARCTVNKHSNGNATYFAFLLCSVQRNLFSQN